MGHAVGAGAREDTAVSLLQRRTRFKIEIESKAQFGVDGELTGQLEKAGFTVSLSADRTRHTQFIIEAVFGKEAAAQLDAVVAAVLPDPLAEPSSFMARRKRRTQRTEA